MNNLMLAGLSTILLCTAINIPAIANPEIRNSNSILVAQQPSSLIKSGSFSSLAHSTQGNVRIVNKSGKHYLELDSSFQTDNGPDLLIVLHRASQPGAKFAEGDYVVLGNLQRTNNAQSYEIPANLNLSDYGSVAIWCRKFNVTFGAATLN